MIATHKPAVFVLVIEPDEILANQLAFDLQEAGYDTIVTHDA
ncbi:MAG: DNA-binding response regulator, partial [Nostocales cyanobacterium W4_Combined_metabat2_030]|nr:DNA-binding response regulator [Nostocales cyanobacterium W4_Combined_metabat2_030]